MVRISKKNSVVLLFTFDPRQIKRPWLANYFPFLWDDAFKYFLLIQQVADLAKLATGGNTSIDTFEQPHDLKTFLATGWRQAKPIN